MFYRLKLVLLVYLILSSHARGADEMARPLADQISARSPEVLATYSQAEQMRAQLKTLSPKLQRVCGDLLATQLRMQTETDSWKMYSLYEVFAREGLMTGALQRVGTVTELAGAIPKYTAYRLLKTKQALQPSLLKDGSILIADLGVCGPDPLAVRKGSYYMKCGSYLIGSGLLKTNSMNVKACRNVRVLVNPSLE